MRETGITLSVLIQSCEKLCGKKTLGTCCIRFEVFQTFLIQNTDFLLCPVFA